MENNLGLEFVKVTERAALAASFWLGKGNKSAVDQAAVDSMRKSFEMTNIKGKIVIGEGKKDKAPMLYTGEVVGNGTVPQLDIAVDPVEGTRLVAKGLPNALSVLAAAPQGSLLSAPDMYMKKIAVGAAAKDVINLAATATENIKAVAKAKGKSISEITVVILDRPRHQDLIAELRKLGARIKLIIDGDVAAGIAAALDYTNIDIMMGIGGAPEGVLTAAAIKSLGGGMQAQLQPRNNIEVDEAKKLGIEEMEYIFNIDELVTSEDIIFSATGITNGELVVGVNTHNNHCETNTILIEGKSKGVRNIKLSHKIDGLFQKEVVNL